MIPLSKKYYRFSRLHSKALREVYKTTGQSDPGTGMGTRPDISRRIIESGTLMDKMVRDVAHGIPVSETKFKAVLRTYIEACQEQAETNPRYSLTGR